jgi:hypothetical protein
MRTKLIFLGYQRKGDDYDDFNSDIHLNDLDLKVAPGISLTPEQESYFEYVLKISCAGNYKYVPMFCVHIEEDEKDTPQVKTKKNAKKVNKPAAFEDMQTIVDRFYKDPESFSAVPTDHPQYLDIAKRAMEINPENITKVPTDSSLYDILAKIALDADSGEIIEKIPVDYNNYYDLAEYAVDIDPYNIKYVPQDHDRYYELAKSAIEYDTSVLLEELVELTDSDKCFQMLKELVEDDAELYMSNVPWNYERYNELLKMSLKSCLIIDSYIDKEALEEVVKELIKDSEELAQSKEARRDSPKNITTLPRDKKGRFIKKSI